MKVHVVCVCQWREVYVPVPLVFGNTGTSSGHNLLVAPLCVPIRLRVIGSREDPINNK